ncbi:MAG: hypothetical protein ACOY8P_12600, partial [Thermodesulfobacteriota bacterium]
MLRKPQADFQRVSILELIPSAGPLLIRCLKKVLPGSQWVTAMHQEIMVLFEQAVLILPALVFMLHSPPGNQE